MPMFEMAGRLARSSYKLLTLFDVVESCRTVSWWKTGLDIHLVGYRLLASPFNFSLLDMMGFWKAPASDILPHTRSGGANTSLEGSSLLH